VVEDGRLLIIHEVLTGDTRLGCAKRKCSEGRESRKTGENRERVPEGWGNAANDGGKSYQFLATRQTTIASAKPFEAFSASPLA
jgi:hypothetical protein